MAVGDVYELVCDQVYGTSTVLNVFYYQQHTVVVPLAGQTIAAILAENWDSQVGADVRELQSADVIHREVRVRNLFDPSDAGNYPVSLAGARGEGDTLPPFVAVSYKLTPENPAVRVGAKRFVGIPEGATADGQLTFQAYLDDCEEMAAALEQDITAGSVIQTATWSPVIVKRVRSGTAGAYEYRLPESVGESVVSKIASALFSVVLGSQVSRKFGRGV